MRHPNHHPAVQVNLDACDKLAALIRSKSIPSDKEEIDFSGFTPMEVGNLLFLVVAICHQTSPRGGFPLVGEVNGKLLRGWDFLLQRFENIAALDRLWLRPSRWERATENDLREMFLADGKDLLSEPDRRAELVADLGRVMRNEGWSDLQDMYELCEGRVATGNTNLLYCLKQFRAYRDPVNKKSYFLLALMKNLGLWTYSDTQLLGAPVDYHEVRGHLRIGTVNILSDDLRSRLLAGIHVSEDEDIAIRTAVLEAIMYISDKSGLRNPSQLHYFFWNIFRNFCTREDPNCLGERRETYLPERYRQTADLINGRLACPFNSVCRSVCDQERLLEHVFDTDYY